MGERRERQTQWHQAEVCMADVVLQVVDEMMRKAITHPHQENPKNMMDMIKHDQQDEKM